MTLRVGLVGAGIMGRNHARVVQELGAKLAAVADPDPASRKHIAERYGAAAHAEPDALFKDDALDALVVATPTVHHHAVVRAALEAGKHVLVEKPITHTVDEARDLIALARRKGLVLAVGHVERHNPVVRWAKERLVRGDVGEVVSVSSRRLSPYPERVRDVGVVLDLAIHDVDIVSWLAGSPARGVYARVGRHRKDAPVEDHASILLDFDGGVDAFVEVSWLTPSKVRNVTLTCAEGVVDLDYMQQQVSVSRSRFGDIDPDNMFQVPVELSHERLSLKKEEPLKNEHLDFYRAIREGGRPLVDGEAGLAALRLALAALESGRGLTRVPVEA